MDVHRHDLVFQRHTVAEEFKRPKDREERLASQTDLDVHPEQPPEDLVCGGVNRHPAADRRDDHTLGAGVPVFRCGIHRYQIM